jgi:hypothetical protein
MFVGYQIRFRFFVQEGAVLENSAQSSSRTLLDLSRLFLSGRDLSCDCEQG